MKGIYKELQKYRGPGVENYIIAARTAQGYEDWRFSTPEERHDISTRWSVLQKDLKKKKYFGEEQLQAFQQRRISKRGPLEGGTVGRTESAERSTGAEDQPVTASSFYQTGLTAQTSHGDAKEDELIEQAVRASVAEFAARRGSAEEEDLRRAMEDSVRESWRGAPASRQERSGIPRALDMSTEPLCLQREHEGDIHHSRGRQRPTTNSEGHSTDIDSGIDTDDDENIKAAIANSKIQQVDAEASSDDEDLRKAIAESRRIHEEEQGRQLRGKTDEEVVMEYVKQQSLIEEEYRKTVAQGKKTEAAMPGGDDRDEDLKRAIEQSLRTVGKTGESSSAAGGDGS